MASERNTQHNIYSELFSNLSVPERLSPENIRLMLDANKSAEIKRSEIQVGTAASKIESYKSENAGSKKPTRRLSTAYRAVASIAACAVLAFGVVRYFDAGDALDADSGVKGSAYAENYDNLHQIFRTYYVDDTDKKTLDSAIAEIEHSYNEAQGNQTNSEDSPSALSPEQGDSSNSSVNSEQSDKAPASESSGDASQVNPAQPEIDLPQMSGESEPDNTIIAGQYIFVRDGSTIKVISVSGGQMEYIGDAVPESGIFETKTLEEAYAVGDKLCAVYSVVNEEPLSVPAYGEEDSIVGEIVNGIYTGGSDTVKTKSVEVVVYEITSSDGIKPTVVTSQNGTLIDVKESGGYVYVITDYDDYRHSPLIGVDDLESYVPSYTVNGIKQFILPENILVPEYISTTDYTVISGIAVGVQGCPVLVQAVLGSEGKVVATDKSVYIFGYSDGMGIEKTVCERLSLEYGCARFVGSTSIEGIAVNGGIYENNGTLFVTTLKKAENGYVTSVCALGDNQDGGLSVISSVDFPLAVNQVSFEGSKVFLTNGTDNYAADFTQPANPANIDYCDDVDITSGLVPFGDGYVTLTRTASGGIKLEKLVAGQDGSLTRTAGIVVCEENSVVSKALSDNSIMYTDPMNGYVGVPYGYFDGYDYCYKYELFRLTDDGFVSAGSIESHETEDAFELGRAKLAGGLLYVFSDGRIYSTALGDGALSIVSSADLIESSYSGHTTW